MHMRNEAADSAAMGWAIERLHILVVEDDPLVAEVVADVLADRYVTSRAETAAAALVCLRAGRIDAMLLDCTLPGGLDARLVPTADELGVPVVLMSGYPEPATEVAGGGRPFLPKPFPLATLLTTLQRVVALPAC